MPPRHDGYLIAYSVYLLESVKAVPEELQNFQVNLRQTYFANFSLFQSLPDSWAIDWNEMVRQVRNNLESSVESREITIEESSRFIEMLEKTFQSYTYLGE
jgi:arginine decarboxylase-like protein